MLSKQHFYHRVTRKLVVAFGTMFNNLRLVRYNKAGTVEIERVTVPLSYAGKEKFYARITQDPTLNKEIMMTLPRMAFELTAITYDPLRKVSSHIDLFAPNSNGQLKKVKSAPYNFDFTLSIYVRNTEDGTQIIEQILPYFSPDYTVTIDFLGLNNLKVDVPFILNNVSYEVSNDTGSGEDTRMIIWTLTFTAKAYLYGLIDGDGGKLIKKVTANVYNDIATAGDRKIVLHSGGTGDYKLGELVYEGARLSSANATAFVESWDPVSNNLVVVDTSGVLLAGKYLKGAISGASWNIASFDANPYQLQNITVQPNPLAANANDDFGFTITVEEYPNIT